MLILPLLTICYVNKWSLLCKQMKRLVTPNKHSEEINYRYRYRYRNRNRRVIHSPRGCLKECWNTPPPDRILHTRLWKNYFGATTVAGGKISWKLFLLDCYVTRMHSSMMSTVRCSDRREGSVLMHAGIHRGVSARGGWCLPGEGSAGGGVVCLNACWDTTPLWTESQTPVKT